MKFDLLVFDWDGTLMDSEARIVACVQAGFRDLDLEAPTARQCRNIIGLGLNEAMAQLAPALASRRREAVMDRYRHHFLHVNQTPSTLFPGAAEVIADLHVPATCSPSPPARAAAVWMRCCARPNSGLGFMPRVAPTRRRRSRIRRCCRSCSTNLASRPRTV